MSWRRIVLLSLLFLTVMVSGTWLFLRQSDAATHLVQRELDSLFATKASLQQATVDLAIGRLSITGLAIADPDQAGRNLASIESLHVDIATNPLGHLLSVHQVVAEGLAVDFGPTLPDPARILKPSHGGETVRTLPAISVHRGSVRFTVVAGEPPLCLDDLDLDLLPLEGQSSQFVLRGSARLPEFDATVTMAGDLDLDTGAARCSISTTNVRCDAVLQARLRRLLHFDNAAFNLDGTMRSLTVHVLIPPRTIPPRPATSTTPAVRLEATFEGVRAATAEVPGVVRAATITVQATNENGGSATARLRQQDDRGDLDVTATAKQWTSDLELALRVHGRGIRIDDDVLAALRTFPVGRDVVSALQPTAGLADVDLFLDNPHRHDGRVAMELDLSEAAVSFHGFGDSPDRATFPLPMVDARGHIRLHDGLLLLEDVEAQIPDSCGGGKVRLTGRVETLQASGEETTLDIDADSVAFHPELRAALTALLDDDGALYDKLAPTGRAGVSVRIRPRTQLAGGWSVTIRPSNGTMQWAGFPYRLEQLTGSVVARAHGVDFDLTGHHGSGQLSMQGHIPIEGQQGADDAGFEALLSLQEITVDDDLRDAVSVLAPELDARWRAAEPSGRFHGQVKVWRPTPEEPLQHDANFELDGVSLRLPVTPWRAIDLHGQLFVQGLAGATRLDFDALRGQLDHGDGKPAQLAMLGHLTTGGNGGDDLSFVVRELELDDELGRTLQRLDALDLDAWQSLAPSGRVDLVCRHERSTLHDDRLRLVVQLTDVRSAASILPHPAEHATGELTIANGELLFRDLRAQMGGALVQCWDGRVRTRPAPDSRTEIGFAVRASGLPVDDGLANLFSGPLRQAVLDRHLAGRTDVDGLHLQFAIPKRDSKLPFETVLDGQLRLYDVDMSLGQGPDGIRVENIGGTVTLAESHVTDEGGGLSGTLRGGSLKLFGQPFEAVETTFRADAERIQLDSLGSRFHGGSLRGTAAERPALTYLLPAPTTPDGRLQGELTFERVDVFSFLSTCGWTNAPYSGTANGQFVLQHLDGNRVVDAEGQGNLTIDRANLGVVPLFTAIYAQLPVADRPVFNHMQLGWRMRDGRVEFDHLDVKSDVLGAKGKGTLDLDGYVDIEMTLNNLLGASADPIVMRLIDFLAKNIVTFHLFGYLRDLRAEKRWLTESSPKRRAVVPMPPDDPKPTSPGF